MITKAIYIGAGEDIEPFQSLRHIQRFVCIDTCPISFFGTIRIEHYSKDGYVWIQAYIQKMEEIGWMEIKSNRRRYNYPILRFMNPITHQTMNYYYATSFPDMVYKALELDLRGATTLISIGHHPNKQVLEYLTPSFELVVSKHTCYSLDDNDQEEQEWIYVPTISNRISRIIEITDQLSISEVPVSLEYLEAFFRHEHDLR